MSNYRYAVETQPNHHIEAKLLSISTSKYEADWQSLLHTHYFAEVFYVLHGRGQFLVGNTSFQVKENDFVIVNPHVEHTETSLQSSPLEYIVLGIDGIAFSFGGDSHGNTTEGYRLFSYQNQRTEIRVFLKALLEDAQTEKPYFETVCQNLLEVMLINIMRQANFSFSVIPTRRIHLACDIAKRYIDAHFKENVLLDDLAEQAHINKYYLTHLFTKDYGMSPINYLIAKRIDECKMLLENTNYSMAQVASITGFSSQSYFSQMFKKIIGKTPNQYRTQTLKATGRLAAQ